MPEDTRRELENTREAIAALKAEAADLQGQPVSRDEALAALDEWIARRARECEPPVGNLLRGRPECDLTVLDAGGRRDAEAMLCAIVPDAVRDFVTPRIDAALDGQPTASAEERQRRLADIEAELLRLQNDEESIIQHLEDAGIPTARRADADPRAVLGLDQPPRRPAPPPRTYQIDRTPKRKAAAR